MCQIQIDLLEVANDPLLYSPTWIETLGAIETFTLHFATFHDTLRPNFWSIARCRHEGWYDKASQPRLFTNFYRPPSWPTGFSGIPVTGSFLPVKLVHPCYRLLFPLRHFILPRNLDEIPFFPLFFIARTLPSISSSDSTFLNFLPLLIFSPLTTRSRGKKIGPRKRTKKLFIRSWTTYRLYSTLTCDNNHCTGDIRGSTWLSFYLCAYLTRMQVKYLDEVLTVRRDLRLFVPWRAISDNGW